MMKTTKMLLQEIKETQSEILSTEAILHAAKEKVSHYLAADKSKSTALVFPIVGFIAGFLLSFIPFSNIVKLAKRPYFISIARSAFNLL